MIKQSVLNTFKRLGIDETLDNSQKTAITANWLSGESFYVTPLIARCIQRVYELQLEFEEGKPSVSVSDFDRLRYFVLHEDSNAYMTCLD